MARTAFHVNYGKDMKICDVTQFYSPVGGGVRRYLHEKQRYIERFTEDEHLLLVPGAQTELKREGLLSVCTIQAPSISKSSRYRLLLNLNEAARQIKAYQPDLIECGDPYHLSWRMITVARELNVPIVGFYHSHFPEAYLRTLFKYTGPLAGQLAMDYAEDYIVKLYNELDQTLVPSIFLKDLLIKWGVTRAVPVRLGIDAEIFYPVDEEKRLAIRKELNWPNSRIVLLYIGRLAGEKNTRLLMETFKILDKNFPGKFFFAVIGDGQLQEVVSKSMAELEASYWKSYCNDSGQLANYYRVADLFVHPGIHETFGLVTLETQACGTPVVGIRGSYMDAHIAKGLENWAEENSPYSLAQAILRFSDSALREIGYEASEKIRAEYDWRAVFGELWNVYQDVLKRKNGRLSHLNCNKDEK